MVFIPDWKTQEETCIGCGLNKKIHKITYNGHERDCLAKKTQEKIKMIEDAGKSAGNSKLFFFWIF